MDTLENVAFTFSPSDWGNQHGSDPSHFNLLESAVLSDCEFKNSGTLYYFSKWNFYDKCTT